MTDTTNGWGNSTVATAYIYERIHDILDNEDTEVLIQELSNLSSELATAFHGDTGVKIGVHLGWNNPANPPHN